MREYHGSGRIGWLRAAVLGANDGIISTSSLLIGVAYFVCGMIGGTTETSVMIATWAPNVVCVPPSGSVFPRGLSLVTCTATDASGNASVCQFPVWVTPTIRLR